MLNADQNCELHFFDAQLCHMSLALLIAALCFPVNTLSTVKARDAKEPPRTTG